MRKKTLCLPMVTYRDDKGRIYEFITNHFEINNQEVALIYKIRRQIELFFKKIEAKLSIKLFPFRDRKRSQNTNLDYTHRTTTFDGSKNKIQNKKDIFDI
jgi:fructose-1,6-bisphosphatase